MALTVVQGPNNLSVAFDDTTDFALATYIPLGVRLTAIRFYPSAINDVLIVREKAITGVHKWKVKDVAGGGVHYECKPHKSLPVIDRSECTFGTSANTLVIFEFV